MKSSSSIKKSWNKGVLMPVLLLIMCDVELHAGAPVSHPNTVAFSETSPHYKRIMLPSGRYRPESYAFSMGNLINRSGADESLTKLSFHEIGGILAEALLEADYVPTRNAEETDLLVVVSWGKSTPRDSGMGTIAEDQLSSAFDSLSQLAGTDEFFGGATEDVDLPVLESEYVSDLHEAIALQEMAMYSRMQANSYNATLLGYEVALQRAVEMSDSFGFMFSDREELLTDLESARYFVVLQVYDFQKLWKDKERDLLWTSRFSIRAKGHQFDEELQAMAMASCREFGKASKKLRRHLQPARVEFGELEYLGADPKD